MADFWSKPRGVMQGNRTGVVLMALSLPLGGALALAAVFARALSDALAHDASISQAIATAVSAALLAYGLVATPLGVFCGAVIAIPLGSALQRKPLAPALAWVYAPGFTAALVVGWSDVFIAVPAVALAMLVGGVIARLSIADAPAARASPHA